MLAVLSNAAYKFVLDMRNFARVGAQLSKLFKSPRGSNRTWAQVLVGNDD